MEPRQDESKKVSETRNAERPRRFRIVKLEDRIAPGSANTHGMKCNLTLKCSRDVMFC
jgi:hypothetical protein